MNSPVMFIDAVKYSTKIQLEAIFDHVSVQVHDVSYGYQNGYVEIVVQVVHRGKRYGYKRNIDKRMIDENFYKGYMREAFPRRIARELLDSLMSQVL